MGKGLFEAHLIWYSWFWLFELEEKVSSAILELEQSNKKKLQQNTLIRPHFRKVPRHVCFGREITRQLKVQEEEHKERSLCYGFHALQSAMS